MSNGGINVDYLFQTIKHNLKRTLLLSTLALAVTPVFSASLDLSNRNKEDIAQDSARKPAEVIEFAGVKAGDKVLDLLGGGGYYSELLSRVVGEKGEVVLQIPQAYLKYVGKELDMRLADNRLANVSKLLSESSDLKLGENRFDNVFLVLGYHDMFFTEDGWDFRADIVIPQVIKSLKAGGKLLIIDHNTGSGRGIEDTKTLHRIEKSFTVSDLEKRGFKLLKESALLENKTDDHSLIVFDPKVRRKTDRFMLLFEKK
jgi:predicted methyltransferase